MQRYGLTVPLEGVPLHAHREVYAELSDLGYTDVWSAEVNGADAFTPLALAAAWSPSLRLGTAIVPAYTRGPAVIAQSAAALAGAAPGRFVLGVGSSSNVIVESWNGIPFDRPYERTRDTVRFLRQALRGEKVTADFETFSVRGFTLGLVPDEPVPILVAGLREGMLRLAGREGDGAVINMLSPDDVARVAPIVHGAAGNERREIVARIFVVPVADPEAARSMGRFVLAMYLTVPVYAAFHRWLGRGDLLADLWERWGNHDRKGALAAIPDAVVDELIVWGPPEACRETIGRYVDNGVTTPVLALVPLGYDMGRAIRELAPRLSPLPDGAGTVTRSPGPHRRRAATVPDHTTEGTVPRTDSGEAAMSYTDDPSYQEGQDNVQAKADQVSQDVNAQFGLNVAMTAEQFAQIQSGYDVGAVWPELGQAADEAGLNPSEVNDFVQQAVANSQESGGGGGGGGDYTQDPSYQEGQDAVQGKADQVSQDLNTEFGLDVAMTAEHFAQIQSGYDVGAVWPELGQAADAAGADPAQVNSFVQQAVANYQ